MSIIARLVTRSRASVRSSGLPMAIDVVALNNAGHDPDTLMVTHGASRDVSLRNALRQLLGQCGLTYIAVNEALTVTTPEEAQSHPIIVSYPLPRGIHERLLAEFADGKPVVRVHRVASAEARSSLAESLREVCNATLGEAGDQGATVKVVGDSVVVLSRSPEFHAVAGQAIVAVGGVPPPESCRQDPSAPDIAEPL